MCCYLAINQSLIALNCYRSLLLILVSLVILFVIIVISDNMASYSNNEYADIMFCYGFADGNAAAARREYQRRFPDRRLPHVTVFGSTYRRLSETGSVQRAQFNAGRPRRYTADEEDTILQCFIDDPNISTNIVARQLSMSQWKVWSVVHLSGRHPYHYQPVQTLHEGDPARRLEFSRFMLNADADQEHFLRNILWTDESKFDRDGITNYHNLHFWAPKAGRNPKKLKETASQMRFSLNVWMGVVDNYLVGPHFLPQNLNGQNYEEFLRNNLDDLLADVPEEIKNNLMFQHDGCPAHYRITVRQWLDERYPNRWIGRGGPIPWPARSPDITPLDFYVWGHMKELVYVTPINSVEELRQRIINAAQQMRTTFTSRVTKTEVRKRIRTCIRNRGAHFEQDV